MPLPCDRELPAGMRGFKRLERVERLLKAIRAVDRDAELVLPQEPGQTFEVARRRIGAHVGSARAVAGIDLDPGL